jgi:hypothetical protein
MGNGSPRLRRQIALRPSACARLSGLRRWTERRPVTAARSGDLPPLQLSLRLWFERPG